MSMDLPTFLEDARTFVGDGPTDNLARLESLNNPDLAGSGINIINGTNVLFYVENYPIASVVLVLVDGSPISPSGYTLDETTGLFTFNVAPANTANVTYYYYLMDDTSWTNFVQDGLSRMKLSTNDPASDIENVDPGLISALTSYAAGSWARRIAGQSGLWYNKRLQERQEDRNDISNKFMKQSEAYLKDGDIARDDFYKGAGQQYKPAMAIVQHTPRPYTPMR